MIKCDNCNFENDAATKYCQNCGNLLKQKKIIKIIKSFNFGSIAGMGSKGVSIAPLIGMNLDKSKNIDNFDKVKKKHSLDDGSWFCPYCGQKNKINNLFCKNCSRFKP